MITVFELKHKGLCRCFVRTPFYIKNFVLLVILSFLLGFIYLIYFRKDVMVIQNIPKVIKGLNSKPFNYLESHSKSLNMGSAIQSYPSTLEAQTFMADCLRINRPCKMEGLARSWYATERWVIANNGPSYL